MNVVKSRKRTHSFWCIFAVLIDLACLGYGFESVTDAHWGGWPVLLLLERP